MAEMASRARLRANLPSRKALKKAKSKWQTNWCDNDLSLIENGRFNCSLDFETLSKRRFNP